MSLVSPSSFKALLTASSPDKTAAFAARVSEVLGAGDTVLLEGPIGAGKSHFVRSAMRSLAVSEDIPSPTFTLVQTYQTSKLEIWHADLYRLTDSNEIDELGLFEAMDTALVFVEWPELLGADRPCNALTIRFELTDDPEIRVLHLTSEENSWATRLGLVSGEAHA